MAIVVMGVSGAGKSTIAAAIAREIGGVFLDADDLHPPANVAKMTAGIPLTDEDRMPWLALCGEALVHARERGEVPVLACSALRRRYRDAIRTVSPDTYFVQLDGSPELLAARVSGRAGHFMPPALLASQLQTLESLGADERGVVVDVALDPAQIAEAAVAAWRRSAPEPAHTEE